jgi:ribulose 1,5-bisphosphate synthetase/thiazole synthase
MRWRKIPRRSRSLISPETSSSLVELIFVVVGAGPAGLAAAVYGASAVGEGGMAVRLVHEHFNRGKEQPR